MRKILFYAAALAVVLASCSQKDMTDKTPETPETEKQGTAFEGTSEVNTGENPLSRTSLDYDRAARTLTYYWEPNDKIWLDDNNSAEADFTVKAATGRFMFTSGTFNAPNYNVYYTGTNGTSHNTVNIATTQTQGTPNTTSHIGESGDCGTALATRTSAGKYGFTLTHRSAYLCFLPRTTNVTETGWVLTAVKVTSDNNIAGNYTLYPLTAHLFSEYSNTKYYLWDAEHDMWEGKTPVDYASGLYAASDKITLAGSGYTSIPADQYRWLNSNPPEVTGFTMVHGYGNKFYYATRKAKDCPNVWELAWYYDKGDIHWDDEAAFLFRGKIYHGGVWIKKQSVIAAENSTTVAALKNTYPGVHHGNTDDLIHPDAGMGLEKAPVQGVPSPATLKNYFFLPPLGTYGGEGGGYITPNDWNKLYGLGTYGAYMCSNTYDNLQWFYTWALDFTRTTVRLNNEQNMRNGLPLWKAQ